MDMTTPVTLQTPQTPMYWKPCQIYLQLRLTWNGITALRYRQVYHWNPLNLSPSTLHRRTQQVPKLTVRMEHPNCLLTASHMVAQVPQFRVHAKDRHSIIPVKTHSEIPIGPLSPPSVTGRSHTGQRCAHPHPRQWKTFWRYHQYVFTL